MQRRDMLKALVNSLCVVGPVAFASACGGDGSGSDRIVLYSRAPERGNWSLREIHVARGRPITIDVRNFDVTTHSFVLPALNLDSGFLKPGETQEVTLTPESQGEFLFFCGVWCSDYHMYETGYLIVE
jgi:heme/copper-type cytochrome/quinol oxidase subunit 2